MAKLTKAQAVAIARQSYQVPDGTVSIQAQMRLPEDLAKQFRKLSSVDRGKIIEIGATIEANGYLFLYDIIEALGANSISTIISDDITIVTNGKTYSGDNQFELLIEVIEDLLRKN
jgi:hypothetical protein